MAKKIWDAETGTLIDGNYLESINEGLEIGNNFLGIVTKMFNVKKARNKALDPVIVFETIQKKNILDTIVVLRKEGILTEEEFKLLMLAHENTRIC